MEKSLSFLADKWVITSTYHNHSGSAQKVLTLENGFSANPQPSQVRYFDSEQEASDFATEAKETYLGANSMAKVVSREAGKIIRLGYQVTGPGQVTDEKDFYFKKANCYEWREQAEQMAEDYKETNNLSDGRKRYVNGNASRIWKVLVALGELEAYQIRVTEDGFAISTLAEDIKSKLDEKGDHEGSEDYLVDIEIAQESAEAESAQEA